MQGQIKPNAGKGPVRVQGKVAAKADLTDLATKVNDANTPHKGQSPPGLGVVLYADLDKASARKAKRALKKVKGVDAKNSKANAKKGEISVKLSGARKDKKPKVTVADIVTALKKAGIDASATE